MDSPITQYTPTPNKNPGGNSMEGVLIHHWGDPETGPTFDGIVAHLTNPASQVSAHFVAQEGRAAQLADLNDTCWHAGPANSFTIGVECHPRRSDGDVIEVARLIGWIWQQLGRKTPIGTHNYYMPTACPGAWEQLVDDKTLENLATQAYEGKEIEDMQPIEVWNVSLKGKAGHVFHAQDFLTGTANDVVKVLRTVVEANERTKVIAGAIASAGEIDREKIEATVKEAVDKAMEGYELTLAPKQDKGETHE